MLTFGTQSPYLWAENVEQKHPLGVSSQVLEIFRLFGSSYPLFPNFRKLDCSDHRHIINVQFMPMFLGPKLTHLRLHIHASDRRTSELILAHLPILAPHLRGLEISGFSLEGRSKFNTTTCLPFATQTFSGLKCLEMFSCVSDIPLSFKSFVELSSLPQLSSLSLENS